MVWALAVTETVAYAALFYCFAVMVVPMRAGLGASTGQLSRRAVARDRGRGARGRAGRAALDRHGARALMAGGSLLGAASVVAWSQARSLPQLYLAFVGVGLAGAAVLYEPAFALINTWFRRDRPAALLTLTMVAGFSSTDLPPASQALVDAYGWRSALLVLAALLGACAVPAGGAPASVAGRPGPRPVDGRPSAEPPARPPGRRLRRARRWAWQAPPCAGSRSPPSWRRSPCTVVAVHLVAYLRDDRRRPPAPPPPAQARSASCRCRPGRAHRASPPASGSPGSPRRWWPPRPSASPRSSRCRARPDWSPSCCCSAPGSGS